MEVVECLSAQGIFLKPPGTGTSPEEFPLQSSSALLRLWGGGNLDFGPKCENASSQTAEGSKGSRCGESGRGGEGTGDHLSAAMRLECFLTPRRSPSHLQAEAAASGAADEGGTAPMSVLGGIGGQAVSAKKTKTKRTPGEIRIQKGLITMCTSFPMRRFILVAMTSVFSAT